MTLYAAIERKVRASFARQGFMATLNAELVEVVQGRVTITAPITQAVSQQHGAGHAGLAFAIGDSAAGYAALTVIEGETDVMTAEMKINLLRPAIGAELRAEGKVIKAGRQLIVVQAEVFAGDKQVALMQGTMVRA